MTRDDYLQEILDIAYKPLLLQIGTGIGKTRIAIELLKKWDAKRIFILVPQRSIKLSWKTEMDKWKFDKTGKTIEIQCYASIHKFAETKWDAIICDEGHHVTERCLEYFETIEFDHFAALSATVPKAAKLRIKELVPNIIEYKISAKRLLPYIGQ